MQGFGVWNLGLRVRGFKVSRRGFANDSSYAWKGHGSPRIMFLSLMVTLGFWQSKLRACFASSQST